jgi:hypothetical protein
MLLVVNPRVDNLLSTNQLQLLHDSNSLPSFFEITCGSLWEKSIVLSCLYTGMIMLDLQNAFDTVGHDILCNKLKVMGVRPTKWLQSCLTDRKQKVSANCTAFEVDRKVGDKLQETIGKWGICFHKQNKHSTFKHAFVALNCCMSRDLLHIFCLHVQISAVSIFFLAVATFWYIKHKKITGKQCIHVTNHLYHGFPS